MSKASDYLHDLAFSPMSERWRKLGPGQVVLNLPQEKRDLLATLKSEDLTNMRYDFIWGNYGNQSR